MRCVPASRLEVPLQLAIIWAASLVALAGCGAKTGLDVPDSSLDGATILDAGVDAALEIPCIEIPLDGGEIQLPLDTQVEVERADVVFAIDTTASMTQEIDQIRSDLRDVIAPGIQATIRDSRIGVVTIGDFDINACGRAGDTAFELILPVTDDIGDVQSAVDGIVTNNGGDEPEAQVEAIYQIATGEGLDRWIRPSFGCASGGFGYPCFRRDALSVVLLFTDAPFHNGPGGRNPYSACGIAPPPHTYAEAVAAARDSDIRVIGLYSGSGGDGVSHLRSLASDTDALAGGQPLFFDIGVAGQRLTTAVIQSITTLADVVTLDIDTALVDVDTTDSVDPRGFVAAVIPTSATPSDGVGGIDVSAGAFREVKTGTSVLFTLLLRNDIVAPGVGPQRFQLEIVFRGDARTRIASQLVDIVVPGSDGSGCEMINNSMLP